MSDNEFIELREFKNTGTVNEITKPYLYPVAQINYGLAISHIASSAIDISESLLLTTGIKGAFILSELIPNPARITQPSGSEDISPHISTGF